MAKKLKKKITTVHAHPMRVPVSKKNPSGTTVRAQHQRRLDGTFLDAIQIEEVFENYDRKRIDYPAKGKLTKYKNADKYDDLIVSPILEKILKKISRLLG